MDKEKTVGSACPVYRSPCTFYEEYLELKRELESALRSMERDTLTGLYSFNHMRNALSTEMERTRRSGRPTGLIMADLDHFKPINDNHGHQAGNIILKSVSALWQKALRATDIPCRYGGEEFTFILPESTLSQAVRTAERLRSVLDRTPIEIDDLNIQVTASFGVEVYFPKDGISVDEFLVKADAFLRDAKKKGRNQVCYRDEKKGHKVPTEVNKEERAALFIKRWSI